MTSSRHTRWASPLAQQFTTVFTTPSVHIRTDSPGLIKLPSGALLCSFVLVRTRVGADFSDHDLRDGSSVTPEIETHFYRSDDGGDSWRHVGQIDLDDGLPFLHGGKLYFLCNRVGRRDILITRSDDEGETWEPPVTLFEGSFWNTASGFAVSSGHLYWSFGAPNDHGLYNKAGSRIVTIAGDLSQDLLSPAAWRLSPPLTYPGTPEVLRGGVAGGLYSPRDDVASAYEDHWLEPNVIEVQGSIRVLVRNRIHGYATGGMVSVCDVKDDARHLTQRFVGFFPMPGGQNNFHVIRDDPSDLYWATVSLVTDSQGVRGRWRAWKDRGFSGPPGNERRILGLLYSVDALNWFQAGAVAMWPSPMQAFNYASPVIDGDDLLVASRTSREGRNQHDNDLITFHRVRDFRALALPVHGLW